MIARMYGSRINTIDELEHLYGVPQETSVIKETDHLTAEYRTLIEASPFAVLATAGPGGLDCSPRGDFPGFVRVDDDRTLLLPDRRGNNRADSLRNILSDPRVALIFFIPGLDLTLRVNGRAYVTADTALLESFAVDGKAPRSVVVIAIEAVFFQCARALMRSDLWNPAKHRNPASLPTAGKILAAISQSRFGGEDYDEAFPERAKQTLW